MGMPPMKNPSSRLYWNPQEEHLSWRLNRFSRTSTLATTRTTVADRTVQIERLHILPYPIARLKNIKVNQAILCCNALLCISARRRRGLQPWAISLGPYADRIGRDGVILRFEERKVVGKVLDEHFRTRWSWAGPCALAWRARRRAPCPSRRSQSSRRSDARRSSDGGGCPPREFGTRAHWSGANSLTSNLPTIQRSPLGSTTTFSPVWERIRRPFSS